MKLVGTILILLALSIASSCFAQTTYVTPDGGGGYVIQTVPAQPWATVPQRPPVTVQQPNLMNQYERNGAAQQQRQNELIRQQQRQYLEETDDNDD